MFVSSKEYRELYSSWEFILYWGKDEELMSFQCFLAHNRSTLGFIFYEDLVTFDK